MLRYAMLCYAMLGYGGQLRAENDGANGGDGGGGGGGCCGVGATAATTMIFFASRPAPQ